MIHGKVLKILRKLSLSLINDTNMTIERKNEPLREPDLQPNLLTVGETKLDLKPTVWKLLHLKLGICGSITESSENPLSLK